MRISENDVTASGLGVQRLRERLDVPRPVRAAIGCEGDHDGRTDQRHVGDLDAADQQRQEAQPGHQLLGGKRGGAGAVVAEATS